ncbi:hypothetical protein [Bosea sp. BH3]|uniref:hypothetical protein n=1 Tax=Bosea sp. BH3 TaxID=2871701 RepID=UPI0021CB7B88|nr:hypothetical protein [Bosea sp. BH3]MCU4179238.1 hypothetical protein [Bosea sp. BH3]
MNRIVPLLEGLFAGAVFFVTFLYAVSFIADRVASRAINSGVPTPMPELLAINLLMLGAFTMQHSTFVRRAFKRVIRSA